jgi:hypothetical protein
MYVLRITISVASYANISRFVEMETNKILTIFGLNNVMMEILNLMTDVLLNVK